MKIHHVAPRSFSQRLLLLGALLALASFVTGCEHEGPVYQVVSSPATKAQKCPEPTVCPTPAAPAAAKAAKPSHKRSLFARGPLGAVYQPRPTRARPNGVYAIGALPHYVAPLAPGPGRALVQRYCTVCHNTTYITMQPPLPPAKWKAEVDKMKKVFGATIPPDVAKKIVAYLSENYAPKTIARTYRNLYHKAPAAASTAKHGQGKALYLQKCVACHQASGKGLPGAFPPLVAHFPKLAQAKGGRAYIIRILFYGLQGKLKVEGKTYQSAMPPLTATSDADLARILNYISHAWGNDKRLGKGFAPFTAKEVRAARQQKSTPTQNHAQRPAL